MISSLGNVDGSLNRMIAAAGGSGAARVGALRRALGGEQADGTQKAKPASESGGVGKSELTEEEKEQVEELKQRDAEVRRHEQAHKAAAGSHARGGPTYEYQSGPDGRRYAVGGQVNIDLSPVKGDPQATITKMGQVRRAALSPAEPSGQDRQVAAKAAAIAQQARSELTEQSQVNAPGTGTPETGAVEAASLGTSSLQAEQENSDPLAPPTLASASAPAADPQTKRFLQSLRQNQAPTRSGRFIDVAV